MHGHSGTSGLFSIRFRECVTTVKTTFIQYINQLPTMLNLFNYKIFNIFYFLSVTKIQIQIRDLDSPTIPKNPDFYKTVTLFVNSDASSDQH